VKARYAIDTFEWDVGGKSWSEEGVSRNLGPLKRSLARNSAPISTSKGETAAKDEGLRRLR